jgi:hypothetical protein
MAIEDRKGDLLFFVSFEEDPKGAPAGVGKYFDGNGFPRFSGWRIF